MRMAFCCCCRARRRDRRWTLLTVVGSRCPTAAVVLVGFHRTLSLPAVTMPPPAVTMSLAQQSRAASRDAYEHRDTRCAAITFHKPTHDRILQVPAYARTTRHKFEHLDALKSVFQAHVAECWAWHAAALYLVLQMTSRVKTCGKLLRQQRYDTAMAVYKRFKRGGSPESAMNYLERAEQALESLHYLLSVAARETYLQAEVGQMRIACSNIESSISTLATGRVCVGWCAGPDVAGKCSRGHGSAPPNSA